MRCPEHNERLIGDAFKQKGYCMVCKRWYDLADLRKEAQRDEMS